MSKKLLITLIFFGLAISSTTAQIQKKLTIEEMFNLAETNNTSLKVSKIAVKEAVQSIKDAKNKMLPSIEASIGASYIGDGVITDRDFSNAMKAPIPHWGNTFAFKATQVIYAGGAINAGIEMSKIGRDMSEVEFENNRQNIRFMLISHFLDLVQLNNRKQVYLKNIEKTKVLISDINVAIKQGTALKSDLTRYELQLKNIELDLEKTENNISIINRIMTTAIGLENNTEIIPDIDPLSITMEKKSENDWQNLMEKSPVMNLQNLNIKMSKKKEDLIRSEFKPNIGLMLSNNLDGPILIEIPPINKNFNYWFVGLNLSYKFDALFKSPSKLKKAKYSTMKAEETKRMVNEQLSDNINASYIKLEESRNTLKTKEKNLQLAKENYDIIHNRYVNGLSLVTDMLDASNILLNSEIELSNSRIEILYHYYKLKNLVGTI